MLVVGIGETLSFSVIFKNLHQNKIISPRHIWLTYSNLVDVCFQAKGKERQWLKNQALGELDDTKIIDGLTGEKAIYKRRGELEPEVFVFSLNFLIFESATLPKTATHTPTVTHIPLTFICQTVHSSGVCVYEIIITPCCFCSSSLSF